MNRDDYLSLLKSHDDPVHWEYSPSMDYSEVNDRFRQFASELEVRLGRQLMTETGVDIQDASFHSQILLDGCCLRFSNFGNMVASNDDESIDPWILSIIKELTIKHGYLFVPHELLEEEYTGVNPGVTGIRDWWIRYFDYV